MKQRGRKSGGIIGVVSIESARPAPPESLSEEMAETWRQVVTALPGDFFTAAIHPLLESYVRHVAYAATLDKLIADFQPEWLRDSAGLRRFNRLCALRERQTATMLSVARSLRLTNQSRFSAKRAATLAAKGGATRKPWE